MSSPGQDASDYEFELPADLTAHEPPEARGLERHDARLAVLHRADGRVEHRAFRDLGDYLRDSDVLVLNNARVVPTTLHGYDDGGQAISLSVHSPTGDGTWHCLVASEVVLRPETKVALGPQGTIKGRLLYKVSPGAWRIALDADAESIYQVAEPHYPPYLKAAPADPEYYQTVFGSRPGAVLFPSAGRHFTSTMLEQLRERGVAIVEVTLFIAPRYRWWVQKAFNERFGDIEARDDEAHDPAADGSGAVAGVSFPRAERYEIPPETADVINARRQTGARIFVCGTSALRTLETVVDDDGLLWPQQGFTRLTIAPGHRFRACDAFLTNLHLPRSSELVLTSAFAGREYLLQAYRQEIVPHRYRFFEFGDSMLIV